MLTRRGFLGALGAALGAAAVAPLVASGRKVPGWEDLPEVAPPAEPEVPLAEPEAPPRWCRATLDEDENVGIEFSTDGSMWKAGDPLLCARTGEVMRVVQVKGSTLTVVRGTAGSQRQPLLDLDWLLRLGDV